MKAVQFVDGKMKFHGQYNLDDVKANIGMEGDDLRFTLYTDTWKTIDGERVKTRVADALLLDIDDCPMSKAKIFKLRLRKLLADIPYVLVHSGGGLHIYIPISYGFTEEDKPFYKQSYDGWCEELSEALNHQLDNKVFGASKYGRVLGSLNTKYNTKVELLDVHEAEPVHRLSDILDYNDEASPVKNNTVKVVTQALDTKPLHDSPIYKYCNFIKYCDINKASLDFETWSDAINVLNATGHRDYCHAISEGHKGYDFNETETKINSFEGYVGMSCSKLSQKNPTVCAGCKFLRVPQMSPSTITGSRTTVSLHRGHFQLSKGEDGYSIDYSKLDVDSLLNHFLNIHEGKLCTSQEWVYKLDETDVTWKPYFMSSLKTYGSLTNDLEKLTQHEIKPTMLKKVLEYMKVLIPDLPQLPETPSNLVVFKSNVFDTSTRKLRERLPEDYITGTSSTDLSKAEPKKWLKFLHEALPNERDRKLIQEFFGLSLSRLKTYDYQYICWLYGLSGTGKSLIQTIIGDIIGDECSVYFTKDELMDNNLNISNITAKTFLAVSEVTVSGDKAAMTLEKRLNVLTDANLVIKKLYFDKVTVSNRLTTIVTSNDAPPTRSMDQGGARRIRPIEFYNVPEEINYNLRNELIAELPSIANWALEGLLSVLENGVTEMSDEELQAIEDNVQENSSLVAFINNMVTITDNPEDMLPTNLLYQKYEMYCDTHKITDRLDTRHLSIELGTRVQRATAKKKSEIRHRDSSNRYLRYVKWKV